MLYPRVIPPAHADDTTDTTPVRVTPVLVVPVDVLPVLVLHVDALTVPTIANVATRRERIYFIKMKVRK